LDAAGFERVRALAPGGSKWATGLQAGALLLLAFAHRGLLETPLRPGERDVEQEIESWLLLPGEEAPLVVLLLAGWLLYRRWPRIRSLERERGPWWLVATSLATGMGVYLWAGYTGATHLQAFSLLFYAIGLTALYWGFAGLRVLWLPIAFLVFCAPLPAPLFLALIWKMQLVTAEYTGWLLYHLGEPALVSGDQILRARQTFQVIEGCSGLRSAETLTMLVVALIDLFGRRGLHAVVLFLCAPPLAFALNGLRVLTIILNPSSEVVSIHTLQGVAILLVGLLIVYGLDGLLERVLPDAGEGRLALPHRDRGKPGSPRVALVILLLVALATTAASRWGPVWEPPVASPRTLQAQVDEALGEWPSSPSEKDWMFLGSVRFDETAHRSYEVEDVPVEVFVATADLGPGGGSPLSPVTAAPGSGWAVREVAAERLSPDGRLIRARVLAKGRERRLIHAWYGASSSLPREATRSLLGLDNSPFRRERAPYAARLGTPLIDRPPETPAEARARAERRLGQVYERLLPVLKGL
jgi:exosortase